MISMVISETHYVRIGLNNRDRIYPLSIAGMQQKYIPVSHLLHMFH